MVNVTNNHQPTTNQPTNNGEATMDTHTTPQIDNTVRLEALKPIMNTIGDTQEPRDNPRVLLLLIQISMLIDFRSWD